MAAKKTCFEFGFSQEQLDIEPESILREETKSEQNVFPDKMNPDIDEWEKFPEQSAFADFVDKQDEDKRGLGGYPIIDTEMDQSQY